MGNGPLDNGITNSVNPIPNPIIDESLLVISIGDTIDGGIPTCVLYVDSLGLLAQDTAGLTYDASINRLYFGGNSDGFTAFYIYNNNSGNIPEFAVIDNTDQESRIYATLVTSGNIALIKAYNVAGVPKVSFTGDFCNEVIFQSLAVGSKARLDGPSVEVGTVSAESVIIGKTTKDSTINGRLVLSESVRTHGIQTAISYAVLPTDYYVGVTDTSAARTITLPLAATAGTGRVIQIADESGNCSVNNITIQGSGGELINGVATNLLSIDRECIELRCTGAGWQICNVPTIGDLSYSASGKPTASMLMLAYLPSVNTYLPSGLTGSRGKASVAATAATAFSIKKNGVEIGTMNFAIAATTATFAMAANQTIGKTDELTIVAPFVPDATLSDIRFTLAVTR